MINSMIRLLTILVFLVALNVSGEDSRIAKLSPSLPLQLLTNNELNRKPDDCLYVGKSCVKGEFLAILKRSSEPTDLPNAQKLVLNFLQRFDFPNTEGIKFNSVNAYELESPSTSSGYNICGNLLLVIKFSPAYKVNKAMSIVYETLKQQSDPIINSSTLFGIQPHGFGKPPTSSSSEDRPLGLITPATEKIKSKKLLKNHLKEVIVAVLDTGNNNSSSFPLKNTNTKLYQDLTNLDNLAINGFAIDDFYDPEGEEGDIGIGHGTPIASIIGSKDSSIGVAPNANIIAIKICNNNGICLESNTIFGACYAMSKKINASIINLSIAGRIKSPRKDEYHAPIFEGIIRDAERNGTLIVTAAGNSREEKFIVNNPPPPGEKLQPGGEPLFPSIFSSGFRNKMQTVYSDPGPAGSGLLSVGATSLNGQYANFATFNSHVDISAPGTWVKVIGKDGQIKDNLSTLAETNASGTSFSAAYVSGAAALLIARGASLNPPKQMTAAQLARLIVKNANPEGCIKTIPNSDECGSGLLDVEAAWLNLAKPGNP
jgi:hypothetical protein